jgi:hypothetical protein
MFGFGDYDRWKLQSDPAEDCEVCDHCGGNLRRAWPPSLGWFCERCDEENECRERQLEEQLEMEA